MKINENLLPESIKNSDALARMCAKTRASGRLPVIDIGDDLVVCEGNTYRIRDGMVCVKTDKGFFLVGQYDDGVPGAVVEAVAKNVAKLGVNEVISTYGKALNG